MSCSSNLWNASQLRRRDELSIIALILPRPHPPLNAARQSLNPQETLGVGLVVRSAAFHRGDAFVVQVIGTAAAGHVDVALVEIEHDLAGHRLLRLADE